MEEEESAASFEHEHVHSVYDAIAPHFHHTRFKPWPKIANFLSSMKKNSVVVDIGCGNGKNYGVNSDVLMLGGDLSRPLLQIAQNRGQECVQLNCLMTPYRNNSFDAVICIAVIHHLSTVERRQRAIQELVRITDTNGRILVYVWAFEQSKKKFSTQDNMIPWHLQNRFKEGKEYQGREKNEAVVYKRFYHLFKKGELESIVECVSGIHVIESGFEHDNWYVIIENNNNH